MRIQVYGDCPTSTALRGNLAKSGFRVCKKLGLGGLGYTVHVQEYAGAYIHIDGIDCELERHMVNGIASLTETPILLMRAGGVQSDREIRVRVPKNDEDQRAVELGIVRGLLKTAKMEKPIPIKFPKASNVGLAIAVLAVLMLFSISLRAQQLSNTVTRLFAGAPTNPCTAFQLAKNAATGHFYSCNQSTLLWVDIGPSSAGVTSVSGTPPIASTGGTTPDISISQAGAGSDGYLSSVDWGTFNGKQAAISTHTAVANNFLTGLTAPNTFTAAQPTWADIDKTVSSLGDLTTRACANLSDSGSLCASSEPLPSNEAGASNNFLTAYNSGTGAFSKAQPSCSSLSDAGTGCSGAAYPGLATHKLLSVTHTGTTAADPVRGDIIYADSVPSWTKLALGAATAGKYAKSDGTDVVISSGSASGTGACGAGQFVSTLNADAAPTCGTPTASLPSGLIVFIATGTCPTGFTEVAGLSGKFVLGTTASGGDVGTTGGSSSYTPAGTNSAPTFTGDALGTHNHGVGTYAASAPTFTGSALGTHSHGVGTYDNAAASGGTPSGTIAWPAGVPTFTGNASTVVVNHVHTQSAGTGTTGNFTSVTTAVDTSSGGTGANPTQTALSTTTGNPTAGGAANYTPAGTIAWPAGVPTLTGNALSNHDHTISGSSEAVSAGTPAGTNSSPALSGSSASVSAGTPTGAVSAPVFTGTGATITPPYIKLIGCQSN